MQPSSENRGQAEFWSGVSGQKWAANQALLSTLFSEAAAAVIDLAAPQPGDSVIDIGCGAGDSTLAAAEAVGPVGRVLGIDVSEPLLEVARRRARAFPQVGFAHADAQIHPFDPQADLVISRFGVMFFADPVAAFRNIAGALRPEGRLVFAAWAPMRENPWSWIARDAGISRLGPPPDEAPGATGQFAFADPAHVIGILTAAGLTHAMAEPREIRLQFAGTPAQAAELATSIGPVARMMQHHGGTEEDRAAITATVAEALAPYRAGDRVAVPARIILYSARR